MQGVFITRKPTLPSTSNPIIEACGVVIVVAIGLVVASFFLLAWLCGWLWDLFKPPTITPAADQWHQLVPDFKLTLRYQFVHTATISDAAAGYFDMQPLLCYQADPPLPFFEGYFSDFRLERADGLFVQKVYFDATFENVLSMPLYFFSYQSQEAEELVELKDYTLETKGNTNDFLLTASGENDDLLIHIVKS